MRLIKPFLVVIATGTVLGALVGSAAAGKFSSSSQTWRAVYSRVEFVGAFGTTTCALTVEGSFHARTSAKVLSTLSGFVTVATISTPCVQGSATILRETLPWHMQYEGFEGALPNITGIRFGIIGSGWRIRESFGVFCLVRTTLAEHVTVRDARETATMRIIESTMSGQIPTGPECLSVRGMIVGRTTAVTGSGGAGITVVLI